MAKGTSKRSAKGAKRAAAPSTKPATAKPVLLSGGNPQIAKGDGDAPVQAYVKAMPGWKRDVGRRLDSLIARGLARRGSAQGREVELAFFGIEGRGWFLAFHCFTNYVKVSFFRGTSLRPVPPGGSKQKEVRSLDIREDGFPQLDEARFSRWVKQASRLPGWGGER